MINYLVDIGRSEEKKKKKKEEYKVVFCLFRNYLASVALI